MNKQIVVFSGCVVNKNKILMVQRNEEENPKAHLKWEFPGGKVDFGETPEESLIRELKEETGRIITIKKLLPFIQTVYWDYEWGQQQTLCFVFLCELLSEGTVTDDHHIADIKWFSITDAKQLDSLPGTREILEIIEREI